MFKDVEKALADLKAGKLIVVVDDDDREAEGDLVGLAELVTPENVNFMTAHARGLICAPVSKSIAERLELSPMSEDNTDAHGTAFTISVDHKETSTGISAFDRAKTIQALASQSSKASDFHRPGHMFPLVGRSGGVLQRRGHTEASLDLARLAGSTEAAYICEILKEDGTMARKADLHAYAEKWDLTMIEVGDITRYVSFQDSPKVKLPSAYGDFELRLFEDEEHREHVLLSKGDLTSDEPLLVRLHSECLTGDIFGSLRCDCGEQLHAAMNQIDKVGRGAILYLRQEGRGIGLKNKLKAYQLQEEGMDTYDANLELGFAPDERDYQIAADILSFLNIKQIKLLTNNPDKLEQLEKSGVEIVERLPLQMPAHQENRAYLQTKQEKFHHLLHIV
ncbi:3,4-dihydroxy 2-butanone 4-phosphate synthase / GTP cyclohydrolase II [Streptococcus equinus]|uniref:Multifunctional fusion protein n=1 Tax=Streptococcus equinus TaxID=1335 RepID=A0A1H0M0A6_STREI|nr:bifunctional 3,4-dihydroxy-2-butanone-4-phosphate synthase/GTP cyclohydrolase II [Streptococcus equinus]SDO73899.1 3,4-dihydroxy 2-butanone 4-phosphate synthase / GTP cyclohydrolase II [Streptococcus equinus]